MSDVKRDGEACVEWVRRSIRRAAVKQGLARGIEVTEAVRRFVAVRGVLDQFAIYERTVRNMHESSTELRHLENELRRLDGRIPDTVATDVEQRAALADALAPHDELRELRQTRHEADFLGIRSAPTWDKHAVLRLRSAAATWTLHVWDPWWLDGVTRLDDATVEDAEHGVRLVSGGRALHLKGPVTVVPGADPTPRFDAAPCPNPAETQAIRELRALIDAVNARARWDYELDDDATPHALALGGTSGAYDNGFRLLFHDVAAARLPARFSHAVFSLLRRDDVPVELRPSTSGWIALGIEAEARSSGAKQHLVVCRGLRFENEGDATLAFRVTADAPLLDSTPPRSLVVVASERREETRAAIASLAGFRAPDKTPQGRALWALGESWPQADGAPDDSRQLSHVVPKLVRALDFRAPLGPDADDKVVDPLASDARRTAQRCEAYELVRLASAYGGSGLDVDLQAISALDDDGFRLTDAAPSDRLLQEARALVVRELVRRQLGLDPRGLALDLEHQSVGRVLADPDADASLSDDEKLARAAELVVLDPAGNGSPVGLDRLLPDPSQRARVASVVPLVKALLVRVPPVADVLARNGSLDRFEVTALLDRDEELREWYVLLRALLEGHRAFPATADKG